MKRKLSLFLATACLFSCLSFGGFAKAANSSSFTDVESSYKHSEAIIALTKLGIINGYDNGDGTYSFKPEGDITRGEFTKIITVALNVANTTVSASTTFTDIDSHWAKSNILVASSRGIVNGFPEDNTFRPDDKVTYEQAVKMIVCSAGYEAAAIALGGWPNGYIQQANALGITKDAISGDQSSPATRATVAQLVYNVLQVNIPEYDVTGKPKSNLKTFLETYLGIVQQNATVVGVEDMVTSACTVDLLPGEMAILTSKGTTIVIDYTTYTTDKSVLENLIGQKTVIYYKASTGAEANTLYEIDTETVKNEIFTIGSEDIDSFSGSILKYYDSNNKSKNLTINADKVSALYYNGVAVDSFSIADIQNWLSPASNDFIYGEVKLTDSGDDGSIDIIDIMDYEILVATKTPSTSDYLVINKAKFTTAPEDYMANVELNPESVHYTLNITNASGKKIAPTSIKQNDVLLVAVSQDGTKKTVLVSSQTLTGKISSYSPELNEITISEKDYVISEYAQNYFADNNITINTGMQATLYLDAFGNIVYGTLNVTTANYTYAYITKAIYNDNSDENVATIKAFIPSSSAVKSYQISGKIKYNGSNRDVAFVAEALRTNVSSDANNIIVPDETIESFDVVKTNACQIARILIEGNEITEINTVIADNYANDSNWGVQTEDSSAIVPYANLERLQYVSANNFGDFIVNSNTTFIYIPEDRTTEKSYSKKSINYFSIGSRYYVQPFNVNSSKIANLVLIYGPETSSTSKPSNGTHVYVAADKPIDATKDEENVYEFNTFAFSKTSSKQYAYEENITAAGSYIDIKDLVAGDLYRVGRDATYYANCELAISFDDVKTVLDGGVYDFTGSDFEWYSSSNTSSAYGRMYVANVVDITEDNGKYMMSVTRNGFVDGEIDPNAVTELPIIDDETIILRLNENKTKVISTVNEESDAEITALDIKTATDFGDMCNKVAVYEYSSTPSKGRACRMILIYE